MNVAALKQQLNETFGHLSNAQVLALTIYGEARGESVEGMIAVGTVILNRVDRKGWMGKSVKEVCLKPYQFSCFLPTDPNFPKLRALAGNWNDDAVGYCHDVAEMMLSGAIPRNSLLSSHNCVQYATTDCQADWIRKMRPLAQIGRHIFYV